MNFAVIPAIDLRAGRVVRLMQGDYDRCTAYPLDPLAVAQSYAEAGAEWLHLIDLDGARSGSLKNLDPLRRLASCDLRVQAGGGIRGKADIERLYEVGATRVVVGSLAIRDPEQVMRWLGEYGAERITLALDTRWHEGAWRLFSAGWEQAEQVTLDTLLPRYIDAGARHLLCTDIARDGMLTGPNFEFYAWLVEQVPGLAVQISGGVHNLADVRKARACGVAGVILGRALLEGRVSMAEALAVAGLTDGDPARC